MNRLTIPVRPTLSLLITSSIALSTLTVLSGCTNSTADYRKLSNAVAHYPQSDYVRSNLKQNSTHANQTDNIQLASSRDSSNNKKYSTKEASDITALLTSRRQSGSARLQHSIRDNGLFNPGVQFAQEEQASRQLSSNQRREQRQSMLSRKSAIDDVLRTALLGNLDIQAALKSARATLNQYDQVAFLDDMLAQYAAFTRDLQLPGTLGKPVKPVQGAFPFPGLQSLKAAVVDQAIENQRLKLKQTTQDVLTATRIAYVELQYIKREITLVSETVELLKLIQKDLQDSYSSSTSAESSRESTGLSELLQIDIELDKKRNQLLTAQNRQRAAYATLNALLDLSPGFKIPVTARLNSPRQLPSTDRLVLLAQSHRVEIALLETERAKVDRMIQLLEKRFYPDFSAGYSLKPNPSGSTETTPRPKIRKDDFFARNDAYLSEVREKRQALTTRIEALKQQTVNEIHQAAENYRTARQTHRMYENDVLPKAQTTLEVARSLLETGKAANLQVIRASETILNYRLLGLKSRRDAAIVKARLERLAGTTL